MHAPFGARTSWPAACIAEISAFPEIDSEKVRVREWVGVRRLVLRGRIRTEWRLRFRSVSIRIPPLFHESRQPVEELVHGGRGMPVPSMTGLPKATEPGDDPRNESLRAGFAFGLRLRFGEGLTHRLDVRHEQRAAVSAALATASTRGDRRDQPCAGLQTPTRRSAIQISEQASIRSALAEHRDTTGDAWLESRRLSPLQAALRRELTRRRSCAHCQSQS